MILISPCDCTLFWEHYGCHWYVCNTFFPMMFYFWTFVSNPWAMLNIGICIVSSSSLVPSWQHGEVASRIGKLLWVLLDFELHSWCLSMFYDPWQWPWRHWDWVASLSGPLWVAWTMSSSAQIIAPSSPLVVSGREADMVSGWCSYGRHVQTTQLS